MKTKFLHLHNNQKVKPVHTVSGLSDGPIQLFVYSNDNKWYLQKEASFRGKHFSVDVSFGDTASPSGAPFELVAVNTDKRMASPLDILPKGCQTGLKVFKA